MFRPFGSLRLQWAQDEELVRDRGWARVHTGGTVVANKHMRGDADQWAWAFTHCLLHLGFGHAEPATAVEALARCVVVTRFQAALRLGRSPFAPLPELPATPEERLVAQWRISGFPRQYTCCRMGGDATARDVPAARVVFCDAAPYDAGYLPVAEIAGRVRVRGRGGTVLQPGVRLLERAEDFPPDAPILVITDGWCDALHIRREHAFLVPEAARLPFTPRGRVFRVG